MSSVFEELGNGRDLTRFVIVDFQELLQIFRVVIDGSNLAQAIIWAETAVADAVDFEIEVLTHGWQKTSKSVLGGHFTRETDAKGIYGETSADEAKALKDEGIEFGAVPWLPKENA